jgi:hypothetical protein
MLRQVHSLVCGAEINFVIKICQILLTDISATSYSREMGTAAGSGIHRKRSAWMTPILGYRCNSAKHQYTGS